MLLWPHVKWPWRKTSHTEEWYKLDSKRNLPLLSKATHKNSTDENTHYLYTVVLQQYPLLITCPKASDCLNKEIDMNLNLVTESKVTKCNSMSHTTVIQKSTGSAGVMERTTPDVFSRACVRDTCNVSRHERGTDYWKVMIVTWFQPVTLISA